MKPKQAKQNVATYHERHAECLDLLDRIAKRVKEHSREQADTPGNWSHIGDLDHVNEQLAYILAHLGDRSAVDVKGLKY